MSKRAKELKTNLIRIRVTDNELEQLNYLAEQNHQNRSTYILNQSLHPQTPNIYTKDFMETIFQLSNFIDNCETNSSVTKDDLNTLRKEVQHLWQFLK